MESLADEARRLDRGAWCEAPVRGVLMDLAGLARRCWLRFGGAGLASGDLGVSEVGAGRGAFGRFALGAVRSSPRSSKSTASSETTCSGRAMRRRAARPLHPGGVEVLVMLRDDLQVLEARADVPGLFRKATEALGDVAGAASRASGAVPRRVRRRTPP